MKSIAHQAAQIALLSIAIAFFSLFFVPPLYRLTVTCGGDVPNLGGADMAGTLCDTYRTWRLVTFVAGGTSALIAGAALTASVIALVLLRDRNAVAAKRCALGLASAAVALFLVRPWGQNMVSLSDFDRQHSSGLFRNLTLRLRIPSFRTSPDDKPAHKQAVLFSTSFTDNEGRTIFSLRELERRGRWSLIAFENVSPPGFSPHGTAVLLMCALRELGRTAVTGKRWLAAADVPGSPGRMYAAFLAAANEPADDLPAHFPAAGSGLRASVADLDDFDFVCRDFSPTPRGTGRIGR